MQRFLSMLASILAVVLSKPVRALASFTGQETRTR
jgi:hypothetical protein